MKECFFQNKNVVKPHQIHSGLVLMFRGEIMHLKKRSQSELKHLKDQTLHDF